MNTFKPELIIQTLVVSPYEQNARVITNTKTQTSMIIDPGADCEDILEIANPALYPVESIFLTHCHIDHCGGVTHILSLLKSKYGQTPTLYYHSSDNPLAQAVDRLSVECGWGPNCKSPKAADIDLKSCPSVMIGHISAQVLFTPGHAPGHCALFIENPQATYSDSEQELKLSGPILFSGDALFQRSIGRTDLPFGNFDQLIESIKTQFFPLPDETLVLSGHGNVTTIGHEKKHNPFLKRIPA